MLLRAGLALLLLLAWPAAAEATVFCVGTNDATCTVTSPGTAADLQGALTSAQGGGTDTVRIGPGTYTAPTASGVTYNANQKISIDGSGAGSTVLQGNGGPANATALNVDADAKTSSTVSDLGVRKSGSAVPFGLRLTDATATDVAVTETGVDAGVGVYLEGDAVLDEATVTLDGGDGVRTFEAGNEISDSAISASEAVDAGISGSQVAVRRSELRPTVTGFVARGPLTNTIENSVVRVSSSGPVTGLIVLADGTLNASHVTVVRTPPGAGYGVQASESVAGDSSTVNLENSIVDGFSTDLRAERRRPAAPR